MKLKQFFKQIIDPMGAKDEKMIEIWNKRPKTVRVTCEFEDGQIRELTGDDAETWAKAQWWVNQGFMSHKEKLRNVDWKTVVKN